MDIADAAVVVVAVQDRVAVAVANVDQAKVVRTQAEALEEAWAEHAVASNVVACEETEVADVQDRVAVLDVGSAGVEVAGILAEALEEAWAGRVVALNVVACDWVASEMAAEAALETVAVACYFDRTVMEAAACDFDSVRAQEVASVDEQVFDALATADAAEKASALAAVVAA